MRSLSLLLAALALLASYAGCRALEPVESSRPASGPPAWTPGELEEHIRYLNGSVDERATGTQGYARAAAYVAARMADAGLQPVFAESFRLLYQTPVNRVHGATLVALGPDTLQFLPGIDHLPDSRSDTGAVRIGEVVVIPPGTVAAPAAGLAGRGVVLDAATATYPALRAMRAAGARVAFVVGPLRPRQSASAVEGLLVVQVSSSAAVGLLGEPYRTAAPGLRTLRRALSLRVAGEWQGAAGGINTLGYVPGKHPVLAQELVLVCADMDAGPSLGGARTLDFEHFGIGTAALLAAAGRTSYLAARSNVPERSMLFAVLSGARLGHVGLRAYLRRPTWPLEATRAVVYVGLPPEEEAEVRALLAEHGLRLVVVPAPEEALFERPSLVIPETSVRRRAVALGRGGFENEDRTPGVDLSDAYAHAADLALALARATEEVALPLAVSPAPFAPVAPDSLRVPDVLPAPPGR